VAEEVNRRYRDKLRKLVDTQVVSITLRRLRDAGRLRLVRKVKVAHEALYANATGPSLIARSCFAGPIGRQHRRSLEREFQDSGSPMISSPEGRAQAVFIRALRRPVGARGI
jgi:hypothetical protein